MSSDGTITVKSEVEVDFPQCVDIKIEPRDSEESSENIEFVGVKVKTEIIDEEENTQIGSTEIKIEPVDNDYEDYQPLPVETELREECETILPDIDDTKNESTIPEGLFDADGREITVSKVKPISYQELKDRGSLIISGKFSCHICPKKFIRETGLSKHLYTHGVEDSRLWCAKCHKKFSTQQKLDRHLKLHDSKTFSCEKCEKKFVYKYNFVKHQNQSACFTTTYTCRYCNKVFTKKYVLTMHEITHVDLKAYACDKCEISFKHRSTLLKHLQNHEGDTTKKRFSCNFCDKKFAYPALVISHTRQHTGERPFSCSICNKTFALKYNAKKHMRVHEKPKILDCSICGKRFPKESRLKYHMQSHCKIKLKPFSCDVCKRHFSKKQSVLRHIAKKHPGLTPNNVY